MLEPLLQEPDKLPEGKSIVRVSILGLDDLSTPVFKGAVDAYVELRLTPGDENAGEQPQRTEIKTETSQPRWSPSATFDFLVTKTTNSKVVFSVYHYNFIGDPLLLGDAVLHLKDVSHALALKKLKLHTDAGLRGSIDLEVHLKTPDELSREQEHVIYEFERWRAIGSSWGHDKDLHFLRMDPGRWGTLDGSHWDHSIDKVAPHVPAGWVVKRSWYTVSTETDPEGWEYGADFFSPWWYAKADGVSLVVRRRTMTREIVCK